MAVEIKKFNGILDTDTPEAEVNYNYHIDAKNVVFRGDGVGKRVQNIFGNIEIANDLLPAGDNITIGVNYDSVKKRIFTFNYNSNNLHGIYIYDIIGGTWSRLLEVGAGTDGDILEFTPDVPIHSINLLYGGDGSVDGDILYFIDSLKRPTQINVDAYLSGTYTVVKRTFIDVIKNPPKKVPQVTYENDTTVSVNNLKNALYQFRTRFKYDNNEKSVYSAASIVPLPYIINNNPNNSDPSKNARIAVYVETGDESVKNIEIIGKRTTDNAVEGWFLISSLNKEELGIADNSYYKYLFYNNGAYVLVDQEETTQLFDYTPDEANTQELLNGNVPIYGGIKEGYDLVNTDIVISKSQVLKMYQYFNGVLFFGYQNSDNSIILFLTGTGTNNGSNEAISLTNTNAIFNVVAKDDTYSNINFSYTSPTQNQAIGDIFIQLISAATTSGWTLVNTTTNSIELSYSTDIIFGCAYTADKINGLVNSDQDATFSLSEASNYDFGIQYFTESGKTNGVMYNARYAVDTPKDFPLPTLLTLEINHRPPLWASYYHIVRTDTETYFKKTYWVTTNALSDDSTISGINNTRYAYVNIGNMVDFANDINTNGGSVSYDFAKGDRIRFLGVFNNTLDQTSPSIYGTFKDYEVIGLKVNPFINGVRRVGNWVQIVYPSNDITSTFKFDGSVYYTSYYILLYTPKKNINTENTTFFEVAKVFEIGNKGTAQAFHIGQEQIQSVDLTTPAIVKIGDGDLFYRTRSVPKNSAKTGINQSYQILGASRPVPYANILPVNFTETAPITISTGILNNTGTNNVSTIGGYPQYSDTALYYNNTASTTKVRLRFSGSVTNDSGEGDYVSFLSILRQSVGLAIIITRQTINVLPTKTAEFSFDTYIEVPSLAKLWMATSCNGLYGYSVSYDSFSVDIIDAGNILIIENTYNDYYPIQTNSDGRPTLIDKDAARIYCPTLLRWGLSYQQNTNINNTNRFKAANFDECDRSKGDIQRFKARQRILRVFQKRGVGQYGVYARFIQNNNGESQLVTTNDIITANNIQYYAGDYGVGDYPTSLVSASNQDYFVDPNRGYQVRLSGDGMTAISEIYKGQYYIRGLLTKYNQKYYKPNGVLAKILGYYDYFEEQYVCILEGGQQVEKEEIIADYTLAFNEKNKSYSSWYDFTPEMSICAEDVVYTWKDGEMWVHNDNVNYCNFYGTQFNASITSVFNQNLIEKKTFLSLTEIANTKWKCPLIYTNMNSYGTQRQESELKDVDFATYESQYHAAFLRDNKSIGGLINGNALKGGLIVIKFEVDNASNFVFLSEVSIKYISSQLTNK